MELCIGTTILAARRAKKLTQEALADLVGVSAAAVSKWETGASYPDITLLPPLARALGLTVDALLDFHPAPSNEELHAISERLRAVFDEQGFAAGQQQAEAVLREYPSCGQLKTLIGGLYFHYLASALAHADDPEQESEALIAHCLALFEQGEAQSETENEKMGARLLRINTLTMLGRCEEAEALIDTLPARQPLDADVLRINLYLAQDKVPEAEQLTRKQLLTHVHEVLSALMYLTTAARRQKDFPSAHRCWDALCAINELFALDRSNDLLIGILLAQDEGSTEQALKLFEQYIDAQLAFTLDYRQNPFFAGTQTRVPTQNEIAEMRRLTLRSIETDGQFAPIRDESRFRAAVERFRAAIPPEA
ncbi:helix-turn-helix domain-containing protein [Agathobaculum sp. Marseille-P7918]|uniref:helix-turn-helix domain-containing protein n=1 Tax=Agathobaculum sp. Marseille-P7918 TaxID=2479843 RepID=UPI0013DDC038|nr:helix-turn-helix transcriptional regulator [Agathobaculum sp. Marseille-P7918]